ncbi:DUF6348 family protein [Spirillospora sp. NPDC048911]|uniref:DUF6348 family protein n=1 Tax=Spirillospora sp. NPDC048911 TaxID=3364527 RepID=UPI00371C8AF4
MSPFVAALAHAGSRLSDLVFSEAALTEDLLLVEAGDGGVPSALGIFEGLLRGHGVVLNGDVRVGAKLFAHPAPAGVMAQVDFAVSHPALAKTLVESFAGHGVTWREAVGGAVNKFERGALHPIVEGLFRAAPDQVQRERYEHPDGGFEFVLGAQLNMFTDRPVPGAGPLLDRLLEALRSEPLIRKVHGLRFFIAYLDGRLQTNEVLLDGERWVGGEAVVAGSRAPLAEGRVAVRLFGLLVPVSDQDSRSVGP